MVESEIVMAPSVSARDLELDRLIRAYGLERPMHPPWEVSADDDLPPARKSD